MEFKPGIERASVKICWIRCCAVARRLGVGVRMPANGCRTGPRVNGLNRIALRPVVGFSACSGHILESAVKTESIFF